MAKISLDQMIGTRSAGFYLKPRANLNIIECCHSPLDTRRAFQRYTYT